MADKHHSQINGELTLPFDVSDAKSIPTQTRVPSVQAYNLIEKIGTPHANAAVSTTSPDGHKDYTRRFKDYTVLQQHVLFWDRDADGQIYLWDTYGTPGVGLQHLLLESHAPRPFVAAGPAVPGHGSDSETYDSEGRFRPQQFEDMFAKYDKSGVGTLTLTELFQLMHGNRNAADPFGWGAALFEFGTTWLLIQKDGKCHKEDVRGVYDGSIFWRIREGRAKGHGWNQGWGIGGDHFVGSVKIKA